MLLEAKKSYLQGLLEGTWESLVGHWGPSGSLRSIVGLLGRILGPLGNLLGGLEGSEGVILVILEAPKMVLEALGSLLGPLGGVLGGSLGGSW